MSTKPELIYEICIDSVESALAAQQAGAHRVELCSNLIEGGTTPSAGMIALTRSAIDIGLHVMIRPRGGDFCYSDTEFLVMQHDVDIVKELGADGVVIGLLKPDGAVDTARTRQLIKRASSMRVTFHRAFDMTRNPFKELEALVDLGVNTVLTSGQENSAYEGLDLITELVERAGDRIAIMPGGGISERNIHRIIQTSGAKEVHFSARVQRESQMNYRNSHTFMGAAFRPPEYVMAVASEDRIRAYMKAAVG